MNTSRSRRRRMQIGADMGDPASIVGCLPAILILVAIMFPVFAQARDRAREVSSESNLKNIGLATMAYGVDYAKFPRMDTMEHFKTDLHPYVDLASDPDLFVEVGADVPYALNKTLSGVGVYKIAEPNKTRIAWELQPHYDGKIAVLYADGHVALVDAGNSQ